MASLIHYVNDTHDLTVPRMLINLVDPLVDAGDVSQAVAASVDSLEAVELASFDQDVIYDFRAQRPIVSYRDGKLVDLSQPHMNLDLVTDMHGENFLYLSGQEPDFRWNTLTSDLLSVVERFGVREVFSFAGMPAGVPHTRPADMLIRTTTRTDVQFVPGVAEQFSQLQDFFEFHAGQTGISVTNIRVRVPFYMAKGPHPFISGALAVIKMTAHLGGPTLPLGDLEQLEDEQLSGLNQMIEEGSDFAQLLANLEEEYDKLPSSAGVTRPAEVLPSMPTAEEIAQAAEQFLASLAKDPLRQAQDEFGRRGAPDSEKRKDGGQGDFEAEQHASLRTVITGRLRRGKHHKD
ncbi:MAG: PAC2 family protein [Actinomycetaceae bacterium]|nr:PAC2 family protein [Arcanobacterium sp.]MDD7687350.1 PAC2 family protein [Actinomycetaceae bacterium]MDY5274119.1 PAC2 family protein [Arcanobacterium sp.]